MTKIIAILILALAVIAARAGNLTEGDAYYTVDRITLLTGVGQTNVVLGTNYIGDSLYHTWYLHTTNLNGNTCEIDFSGDETNWMAWGTVVITNNGTVFTNYVGKQSWVRYSFTGTNALGTLIYLGGR